ncbi:glycosyltransferase family 2 protein [Parablautia intestinalis]|uniref:Glycosyltransferase family 2 protein n=1 Tax=Parablautia intestinalis TaxID=2320100 RepID=A0A3A9A8A0_9FIRM|nr:glycosyltransferase family 2 protein [Parablautia intestinalis]RKI87617.1 glycosyltransferase family 2 protein [Parablautia intestinalis]
MSIKISVIMPVYNVERYLSECIDSVVRQTFKEKEIIVVNDGSTDSSLLILNEYADKYDNIVVLTQKNQGPGPARNNGIQHAKGKYLIFIDPDDFYPSDDCLEALYDAAEKNNVLICGGIIIRNSYGGRSVKRTAGKIKMEEYHLNKIVKVRDYSDVYSHQRYLFRADLIKTNNIFFPDYRLFEDPPFTAKAMVLAGEFYELDKEIYDYRSGHKKTNYSLEKSLDLLRGIRDVLKLAQEYNWQKMYENRLKNINDDFMIPFYKYSFCGNKEVDDTIEEINAIVKDWIGDQESLIVGEEKVRKVREESQIEYKAFVDTLMDKREKIIYGAGLKAHELMEHHIDKMKNVIGVAVTKVQDSSDKFLAGLRVQSIENYLPYSQEALVMITTIPIYQEEIEINLRKLGFKHTVRLNTGKLELAEALLVAR